MKNRIFILLIIMTGFGAASVSPQSFFDKHPNSWLRKGLLDYKKGKFEDAYQKYNKVYKSRQNDPLVNYNMGAIQYKKGNFDTAAYYFDKSIRYVNDPKLKSKAYYNMGNSFMKKQK